MIVGGRRFLDGLGSEAERLHPALIAQLRETGGGEFHGVFARAGSRLGALMLLARPLVGPGFVLTRLEADVPFRLVATSYRGPEGRAALRSTRVFTFSRGRQTITDQVLEIGEPGVLLSRLGDRGRVELVLTCAVTPQGTISMVASQTRVRVGRVRLRVPGPLAPDIRIEDGWDAEHSRRTIAMRARHPLLGTVLEYEGWYAPVASSA